MNNKQGSRPVNNAGRIRQYAIVPTLLAVSMSYATHAFAVQGGVVTAGSGSINTRGNNTTISQTSDRMVVNWANFDIAKNQAVAFNQPNSNSAVLNRITNAAPTQIDGSLTANGRVFVVNPAGVMFGKTAKVDVGSLVASALDVRENEFMNGGSTYTFFGKRGVVFSGSSGDTATVSNDGKLTAREEVVLMGPQVVNRGTIRARDVTLASANAAALDLEGSKFSIQLGQTAQKALAANSGTISANGGDVRLSTAATGALLGAVIQNTGSIEATKASSGQGGSVILESNFSGPVSVGGQVTANNIRISADVPTTNDKRTDVRMM
jgi:filamentous hemagglutinin family protein